ncbi:MAG: RNA pseudouridine synthase [Treponema sp.]|nr:RNA pseudouridine synthase [Treponema sp.]
MSGVITILHEPTDSEPFVVLSKPAGLASAPLNERESKNVLAECARLFPSVKNVKGKKAVEGGLLHRIDTATSGLLLVAASQEFYDHMIAAQEKGLFIKGYRADCDVNADNANTLGAFPPLDAQTVAVTSLSCKQFVADNFLQAQNPAALCGLEISSYFRPFGKGSKEVRPVLPTSNVAALKKIGSKKIYSTKIAKAELLDRSAAKLECKIAQGYRHQVRCHLAWLGFPVRGDRLYNSFCREDSAADQAAACGGMRFEASSLDFPDLFSDKTFRFALD